MWKGYKVLDADAHMHEPQDMWDKRKILWDNAVALYGQRIFS